jgi:hypothetical protein
MAEFGADGGSHSRSDFPVLSNGKSHTNSQLPIAETVKKNSNKIVYNKQLNPTASLLK